MQFLGFSSCMVSHAITIAAEARDLHCRCEVVPV